MSETTEYGAAIRASVTSEVYSATQRQVAAEVFDDAGNLLAGFGKPGSSYGSPPVDDSNPAWLAILKCLTIIELSVSAISGGTIPPEVQAFLDS